MQHVREFATKDTAKLKAVVLCSWY